MARHVATSPYLFHRAVEPIYRSRRGHRDLKRAQKTASTGGAVVHYAWRNRVGWAESTRHRSWSRWRCAALKTIVNTRSC